MEQCKIIYNSLIGKGIATEQARMVLPVKYDDGMDMVRYFVCFQSV